MVTFQVLKENKNLFRCSSCGGHDFVDLHIASMDPPAYRKFQVLVATFTCASCNTVNGIKHTKLEGFLMDRDEADLLIRGD